MKGKFENKRDFILGATVILLIVVWIAIIVINKCIDCFGNAKYWHNRVKVSGEYIIDIDGNIIEECSDYHYKIPFKHGTAKCKDIAGQIYFIDNGFKTIGDRKFSVDTVVLGEYNKESVFTVMEENNIQILDKNMNVILEIPYNTKGIESVNYVVGKVCNNGFFCIKDLKSDKWGYMNVKGEMVIEPKFEWVDDFAGDYAVVYDGKNKGVIDVNGDYVIDPAFRYIDLSDNGIAFVVKEDGDVGRFVDMNGNYVVDKEFIRGERKFSEGFCPVKDCETELWGYIDSEGNYLVEPKYKTAEVFSDGMAIVENEAGLKGYIDATGKEIVPCQYQHARNFGEYDLAPVEVDGSWGYIKKDGSYYIEPSLPEADSFSEGYALVKLAKGQKVEVCK